MKKSLIVLVIGLFVLSGCATTETKVDSPLGMLVNQGCAICSYEQRKAGDQVKITCYEPKDVVEQF